VLYSGSDKRSKVFLRVDEDTDAEELVGRLLASLFEDGVRGGASEDSPSTGNHPCTPQTTEGTSCQRE
jgi:hypothetical protein